MKMERWSGWASALACTLALSGCLAVPVSGGNKEYRPPVTVTNSVPDKVELYPEAVREGDRVVVRLMVSGTFTEKLTERREYEVTEQRKVAFGILPGMASLKPSLAPGGTLLALWANVCFLATPTLNGLFVEPFNPSAVPDGTTLGDGHVFRRSALVGFHKYTLPSRKGEDAPRTSTRSVSRTIPVDGVDLQFTAKPKFWQGCTRTGGAIVLTGVAPGEHTGTLVLPSVPKGHWLEKELAGWVDFEMNVPVKAE